jgi:HAD superfamily hydrolase (TIGR01509 family)
VSITRTYFEERCNGAQEKEFYHTILQDKLGHVRFLKEAIKKSHNVIYQVNREHIKTFPHVKSTLQQLQNEGFVMAVASSSPALYVKQILRQNNIEKYFSVVVSSSEVKHAKPSPEIFLHAQKKLGIPKTQCVIIEDAKAGVIAAKRAGIVCLCLLTSEPIDKIPSSAIIVPTHKDIYPAIKQL